MFYKLCKPHFDGIANQKSHFQNPQSSAGGSSSKSYSSAGILTFWVGSLAWIGTSTSRLNGGRKPTDVYLTMFFVVLFVSFFSLFLLNAMLFFFWK